MRIVILIIFSLLAQQHLRGQDSFPVDKDAAEEYTAEDMEVYSHERIAPEALQTTRSYQEETFTLRRFDEGKWRKIVADVDYHQAPQDKARPLSLSWAGPLLKVIAYIVIVSVVVLLLYFVVRNINFDLKIERTALETDDLEKPVENIETLDVEALLQKARSEGNLRMAVRLYYLGLLKKLHALGMIVWKKDRTNRDYLSQLFARDFFYREVHRLTISYEEAWYGEHTLNGESFQRLSQQFEKLYGEINTVKIL